MWLMDRTYNTIETEKKWIRAWERNKIHLTPSKGTFYSIDTPPPTLSGKMHVGHAFSYSHIDFMARYFRMKGMHVFFPFGTDDNGLPTERMVEKLKNVRSTDMERAAFIKLCNSTINELRDDFVDAWKRLGMSCNFKDIYSTIDKDSITTSQLSFLDLYRKEHLYRKDAPVIWCPECRTAIAQAELKDMESQGFFHDIVFLVGGKEIIVSTTRPEMLGACVAVLVHPHDERYQGLVGKHATVPLYNVDVLIMADEKVEMEKGSGVVMVCSWGDVADVEWSNTFNLPLKIILRPDGKLNEHAGPYVGMTIKEARKKIADDLHKEGKLLGKKQVTHTVNVHERCGTVVEILKAEQWFIRLLDKKEDILEMADKIQWVPEHMKVRFVHWVENLQWDWCISRQRHFGVPFPVWYCTRCGAVVVAEEKQLPVDPLKDKPMKACACGSTSFAGEKDVMDTWATSSLTPQIALGWAQDKKHFETLFPMSLRPQSQDLITVWAFYTIVKALYHHQMIPWKTIMISGYVLDPLGEKMSKSKGNIIEPVEIMNTFGADALRYWTASTKLGEDVRYQEKDLKNGQKLMTKLWNAAKFTFEMVKDYDGKKPKKLEQIDVWMLSKLQRVIRECTEQFEQYEFSKVRVALEVFFWHTFCDNYLEIVKHRFYQEGASEAKKSAQYALSTVLLDVLKMFAPLLPYITEELYQIGFAKQEKQKSIHITMWPSVDEKLVDEKIEKKGDVFVELLSKIRKFKSDHGKSLKIEVDVKIEQKELDLLKGMDNDFKGAAKIRRLEKGVFSVGFV